jgi:predicted short-subunit dehydrogenase-like oxidoreductase (DUF2520 family)
MKTLNVIGAGRLARTLASLWHEQHTFAVQDVLDGTEAGARAATSFIGEGRAVAALPEMRCADAWLISTPDRRIAALCEAVAGARLLRPGDIVFHCSGSLSSGELAAAGTCGALVASVHPLKTFADPREAVRTFAGTYCVMEGERAALDVLAPAFERIGGRISRIDPQSKAVYHAASVIVCNGLTALMESGLRCYERAGFERETASAMMEPIVRETLENVFRLGTVRALTGPIARADSAVVEKHLKALAALDARIAAVYRELGLVALELARAQRPSGAAGLEALSELLTQVQPGTT